MLEVSCESKIADVLFILKQIQNTSGVGSLTKKRDLLKKLILETSGKVLKLIDPRFKKSLNVNIATIKHVLENLPDTGNLKEEVLLDQFLNLNESLLDQKGVSSVSKKQDILALLYSSIDSEYHTLLTSYYQTGTFRVGGSEKFAISCLKELYPTHATHIKSNAESFELFYLYKTYLNCISDNFEIKKEVLYKPMLASPYLDRRFSPKKYYGEAKCDGCRVLMRKRKNVITFWSRSGQLLNTENFLRSTAHISQMILKIKNDDILLDGEIWLDMESSFDSFRLLSPLFKTKKLNPTYYKKYAPHIKYTIFDVLEYDGNLITDWSYVRRRQILEKNDLIRPLLVKNMFLDDLSVKDKFFNIMVGQGYEGIILKHKDSPYEINKRSNFWLKQKPEKDTLDTIILDYKKGTGKYSEIYASFCLGVRGPEGKILEIGHLGSGFTLNDLSVVNKKLIENKNPIILEITADSITRSLTYSSGYALRFPRLVRIRQDKLEPDNISKVLDIYGTQIKKDYEN